MLLEYVSESVSESVSELGRFTVCITLLACVHSITEYVSLAWSKEYVI